MKGINSNWIFLAVMTENKEKAFFQCGPSSRTSSKSKYKKKKKEQKEKWKAKGKSLEPKIIAIINLLNL